jgi:hypothetical protein
VGGGRAAGDGRSVLDPDPDSARPAGVRGGDPDSGVAVSVLAGRWCTGTQVVRRRAGRIVCASSASRSSRRHRCVARPPAVVIACGGYKGRTSNLSILPRGWAVRGGRPGAPSGFAANRTPATGVLQLTVAGLSTRDSLAAQTRRGEPRAPRRGRVGGPTKASSVGLPPGRLRGPTRAAVLVGTRPAVIHEAGVCLPCSGWRCPLCYDTCESE